MRMILIYTMPPICYHLLQMAFPPTPRRAAATVYICICNGFTDRQVRSVCEQQQCRVSEIYKALGCAPKCGKCVPMLKELARADAPALTLGQSAA
jgi:bacterioferritin-associated ferredoxin